ncbi:hypothetical protein Ancab_019850 [Ancistrocladus abbreviatus]
MPWESLHQISTWARLMEFTEESDSSGSTKGLKQLPRGRARKVKCGVDRDCGGIGLGVASAKSIGSRPGVGNDGTLSPT